MTDRGLAQAWAEVHENTPEGWFVGQPGYEERYRQWSQFAFDPSEKAVMSGRERRWNGSQRGGGEDSLLRRRGPLRGWQP